jgi:acetyl esterase/lipase
VIRLGNVSVPQIAVYRPDPALDTGAAVVICPGGGHHILAYDLEGTEVAQWLGSIGVTGIVLKYRVPTRTPDRRFQAAVQDAQRAMSLVRSKAEQWKLDPKRIGICGFSAGGETAALTALFTERQYEAVDAADKLSSVPNFAMLVYPAYLVSKETGQLQQYIEVSKQTPPMFFVHAFDDRVTPLSSLLLASALKQADVSAEVHVYATGGHGYGLRETDQAITHWPRRAGQWLKEQGWLEQP